jgi:hypothetical protein
MVRVLCAVAIVAALTAFRLASPATADPLRTLVYRYSSAMNGFSGGYTGGVHGAVADSTIDSGGSDGTITVQVQAAAKDGGLVIDVYQTIDRSERPLQTIRCAVYSDPNIVACTPGLEPTSEEDTLLSYLGRTFYDPSRLDANNHWQMSLQLDGGKGSLVTDVTAQPQAAGKVSLAISRIMKDWDYDRKTTGSVVYDPAMQIPDSGHIESDVQDRNNSGHSTLDFHLVSDSFAH